MIEGLAYAQMVRIVENAAMAALKHKA